jgi:hypothetical protein
VRLKIHTTNYVDAFIEVAPDCPAKGGIEPPAKAEKTVARLHYEMLHDNPYVYTSDDIIFATFAQHKKIAPVDLPAARSLFFSKGQPCLRTSPLAKKYGWGFHSDGAGRVAIYAVGTAGYARFQASAGIVHMKAMRSSKAPGVKGGR